jgi:TolA-binding protein
LLRRNLLVLLLLVAASGCQTKSDLRREQELSKLRKEVQKARGDKVDIEVTVEEMKGDMSRLSSLLDERAQYQTVQFEAIQKELEALTNRVEALENRPPPEAPRAEPSAGAGAASGSAPVTFEAGKKLYDAGKFEEATETLRAVVKKTPKGRDKKARYWLAESLYSAKDFGAAALEFGDFKKRYPNDELVPKATYRQANAFRSLKKSREAKLFYQELIDRFPKSPLVPKAKTEMAGLK